MAMGCGVGRADVEQLGGLGDCGYLYLINHLDLSGGCYHSYR
jgi:hypothetical protein